MNIAGLSTEILFLVIVTYFLRYAGVIHTDSLKKLSKCAFAYCPWPVACNSMTVWLFAGRGTPSAPGKSGSKHFCVFNNLQWLWVIVVIIDVLSSRADVDWFLWPSKSSLNLYIKGTLMQIWKLLIYSNSYKSDTLKTSHS